MGTDIISFPFSQLSIDLALHIIEFAATPDFRSTQSDNPYASGLALCHVSKAVRRVALPAMLHTVFLPCRSSITKFVAALRVQKGFSLTNQLLFIDYTTYVRRMWVGHNPEPPPSAPRASSFFRTSSREGGGIDFSLLAPVLLGAPSLGVDFSSVSLLCDCLDWAWQHDAPASGEDDTGVDTSLQRSMLPWRTSTLTLSRGFFRWLPFISTSEGSAFLASLPSLILLPEFTDAEDLKKIEDPAEIRSRMMSCAAALCSGIPWGSFHSLQRLTVPMIYTATSLTPVEVAFGSQVLSMQSLSVDHIAVDLFTTEAPLGPSRITAKEWLDRAMQAYVVGGKGDLAPVDVRTLIDDMQKLIYFDWEVCWAQGFPR
ncbi:hypothetical protein BS17DRAFT_783721 [Gyrodon lividus]|nr:hypothetical protein BS17DRAFT_783721 [Gyrodon lividus]